MFLQGIFTNLEFSIILHELLNQQSIASLDRVKIAALVNKTKIVTLNCSGVRKVPPDFSSMYIQMLRIKLPN